VTPFVSPPNSAKTPIIMPSSYSQRGDEAADYHFRHNGLVPPRNDPGNRGSRSQWAGPPQAHGALYDIHEDYEMMSPSDAKRRRYNNAGVAAGPYRPYQSLPSPPTPFSGHHPRQQAQRHPSINGPPSAGPATPGYGPPPSSGPLPGPSAIARGGSNADIAPSLGSMRPPPRPGSVGSGPGGYHQGPRGSIGGPPEYDESLRLPPLQTHLPNSPTSEASAAGMGAAAYSAAPQPGSQDYQTQRDREREAHRRSVEAMVMSIGYMSKLQVLERISPPLPPPGTTGWIMSPGAEPSGGPRGPIIAIEGPNARLLRLVAPIIEKALIASGECDVRSWYLPDNESAQSNPNNTNNPDDVHMTDTASTSRQRGDSTTSSRSGSVTSIAPPSNSFGPYLQAMMDWHAKASEMVNFVTSTPTTATATARIASNASSSEPVTAYPHPDTPNPSSSSHSAIPRKNPLPVALLPAGYSLTASDRFASNIPITDAYAPVDHWQWMATLWRGIAGADLTVYVRAASDEELTQLQGVELKAPGLMVVRVNERELLGGGMAEKTERRLGFEVVEWVRGGVFYHYWGQQGAAGGGGGGFGQRGGWES